MITFIAGIILGLIIGLLVGANNTNKVKKAAEAAQDAANEQIQNLKIRIRKFYCLSSLTIF